MNLRVQSFEELEVYKHAFVLCRSVFQLSKRFPQEERYALTDQIRRASRSIGANLAESWAKRRYSAHFLSKLTDADAELQETKHWVDIVESCNYLDKLESKALREQLSLVGRLLGSMVQESDSFCSTV